MFRFNHALSDAVVAPDVPHSYVTKEMQSVVCLFTPQPPGSHTSFYMPGVLVGTFEDEAGLLLI